MAQNRVFIGNDYLDDAPVAAVEGDSEEAVLSRIFGSSEQVSGDEQQEQVSGEDYDIVGADEEIVGADVKVKAKTATADKLVYDQWLPLTPSAGIAIGAGESIDLELKPQRLFRPGPLAVPAAIAAGLVLTACSIGQENQFVASGGIPFEVFSHLALIKPLSAQTAGPGVSITLSITNVSTAEIKLRGCWFGKSVVR